MRAHVRPSRALVVVVSASLLLTVGIASPAVAVEYPSWDDVQNARASQAATVAAVDEIEGYLVALEQKAAALGRTAQAKGEEYNIAREQLATASTKADRLTAQSKDAAARAAASSQRAGQLIAQFARTGGSSLSLSLLLSDDSDDLLGTLATVSKLTAQSTQIYEQAEHDTNVAASLSAEAKAAVSARQALAASAQSALDAANAASADMLAKLAAQQAAADQLYDQLAALKGTTAQTERDYLAGITNPATPPTTPPVVPPTQPTTPTQPTDPGAPSPPTQPSPPPVDPTPPAPSPSAVETAIAYAYAQIGDPYQYGGAGPDSWDCSGLTKASYAAAGVYIGAHGSTSQYRYLSGQGRLVPVSQVQRGDLVFYSDDGGATTYHTAIYLGGGKIIEAQYEGVPVKVAPLRYYDLMYYAARPTG